MAPSNIATAPTAVPGMRAPEGFVVNGSSALLVSRCQHGSLAALLGRLAPRDWSEAPAHMVATHTLRLQQCTSSAQVQMHGRIRKLAVKCRAGTGQQLYWTNVKGSR